MNKNDYVKCPFCSDFKEFHKLGIAKHVKQVHKVVWSKYKQENLNKFCKICGKKMLFENQITCSYTCNSKLMSMKVKKHKNKFSENTLYKQFLLLSDALKNEIVYYYLNNNVTKTDLVEKYKISFY